MLPHLDLSLNAWATGIECIALSCYITTCFALYFGCVDRVIETPTPVNVSAIRGKWLRDHINDKAGCCGAAELIKLYSYRLVEYDWVIHLDADVLIFQVREKLLRYRTSMLYNDECYVLQSFAELLTQDGYSNRSRIYTTDPNMASYKGEEKLPVQVS